MIFIIILNILQLSKTLYYIIYEKFFNKKKFNCKKFTKEELKKRLTSQQYKVTEENGTDRQHSGKYTTHFTKIGHYLCIVCEIPLFKAQTKYKSSCGWPSFYDGLKNNILEKIDCSYGMNRMEVVCKSCESHLGQ